MRRMTAMGCLLVIGLIYPQLGFADCGYCDTCDINPREVMTTTGCVQCHNDKSSTQGTCVHSDSCSGITACGGGEQDLLQMSFASVRELATTLRTGSPETAARIVAANRSRLELNQDRKVIFVKSACGAVIGVIAIPFAHFVAVEKRLSNVYVERKALPMTLAFGDGT